MELDITEFYNRAAPADYSASAMELGQDAGQITWGHAVEDSSEFMLLDTDEKRDAFKAYIKGFGAWDEEEIAAWSDVELNALLLQFISGDMREMEAFDSVEEYKAAAEAGQVSGRLYVDDVSASYYIGD